MKKKYLIGLLLVLSACIFNINDVSAASGSAYIHYYKQTGYVDRTPTYTWAQPHLQSMGYSVYGYDKAGIGPNPQVLNQMWTGQVFVVHNHGNPGIQYIGTGTTNTSPQITALGTGVLNEKIAVASMGSGTMNSMKLVILYGCKTGAVLPLTGDLPQQLVNKGTTVAVAWTVDTNIDSVNEWNRLFFEKAKTSNVVESFRHADYWLEQIQGTAKANIMKNNRNEKGNIYTTIY